MSRKRSLLKAVTWRIIATADTLLIAFILTGSLTVSASIGALEIVTKTFIYYLHERGWNLIKYE